MFLRAVSVSILALSFSRFGLLGFGNVADTSKVEAELRFRVGASASPSSEELY